MADTHIQAADSHAGVVCLRCRDTMFDGQPHICNVDLDLTVRAPIHLQDQIKGAVAAVVGAYADPETAGVLVVKIPKGTTAQDLITVNAVVVQMIEKLKVVIAARTTAAPLASPPKE